MISELILQSSVFLIHADLFMMTLLPKELSSQPKRCLLPLCQWITLGHEWVCLWIWSVWIKLLTTKSGQSKKTETNCFKMRWMDHSEYMKLIFFSLHLFGLQELGLIRKPASFMTSICDERGQELIYAGMPITEVFKSEIGLGGTLGLLWFQRRSAS